MKIGSKGVMVCYQNETPIKKITIKGRARSAKGKIETLVEVLGEGQQFVGYGWHPKGMKYHWPFDHLGCDPLATPLNKLPAVTPAQIRKSVESICQKLRDLGYHDVHAT